MLAELFLETQPDVPLKGLAVGNGCWGTKVGICAVGTGDAMAIATDFFHAHNMFDDALWDRIQKTCDWDAPTQVPLRWYHGVLPHITVSAIKAASTAPRARSAARG